MLNNHPYCNGTMCLFLEKTWIKTKSFVTLKLNEFVFEMLLRSFCYSAILEQMYLKCILCKFRWNFIIKSTSCKQSRRLDGDIYI